ncbi:hypothetical protein [Streptomyces sp. ISL-11]|uniref:hypothetical protein n=1 Tax=Streptomyces sp. ISL-11 TaxID=2819174 RepID=UPI001BE63C7E|nr:hypothetical protein [Streptomyces sp. ISL-11]MBT2384049.1 hypothetical protein [Streptomyces sp. ISL-11]
MNDAYEYFVKAAPPYTEERPSSLWRRSGEQWEYLSLFDWEWHNVKDTTVGTPPAADSLYPVTAGRAAELEADRQPFVRYWALFVDEEDWRAGEPPTTVVRRRRSPEDRMDESFQEGDVWGPTNAVFESRDLRTSNPPYLKELGADEAEALLQELFGLTGITEL